MSMFMIIFLNKKYSVFKLLFIIYWIIKISKIILYTTIKQFLNKKDNRLTNKYYKEKTKKSPILYL